MKEHDKVRKDPRKEVLNLEIPFIQVQNLPKINVPTTTLEEKFHYRVKDFM